MRHSSVNSRELELVIQAREVQQRLREGAEDVVSKAQGRAPRNTGAGADSIHAEPLEENGRTVGYAVSWDPEHDYMRFHELGTEKMNARPFLRPAVD